MRKLYLALVFWFSLAGPALVGAADAPVPSADTREVQLVVRAQLDAFAVDDAERAFSLAAPSIREMFGTAGQFMLMVRSSYPVVYRPATVSFLKPGLAEGRVVQPVHMTDGRGGSWLAMYQLQRQPDKSWRIAGCILVPDVGKSS